jgi:hypothetical protein
MTAVTSARCQIKLILGHPSRLLLCRMVIPIMVMSWSVRCTNCRPRSSFIFCSHFCLVSDCLLAPALVNHIPVQSVKMVIMSAVPRRRSTSSRRQLIVGLARFAYSKFQSAFAHKFMKVSQSVQWAPFNVSLDYESLGCC